MKATYYHKHYRSGLSSGKLFALAGIVFALSIGVSATSTYAWYSISEQFRIGGFDMEIDHDESFRLGRMIDGEFVDKDEPYTLKEFGYEKPTLDNISNMSVIGYPEAYSDTFLPYFSSGYAANVSQLTKVAESGFVQMEFYCLTSRDAYIYVSPDSKGVVNHEANVEAAKRKGVDVEDLDNVLNATRLSFYSPLGYVIAELGEHEEVNYCGLLDLYGNGYYNTDEDDKEFLFGVYDGTPSYSSSPLQADVDEYDHHDIFHAKHRAGAYRLDESSFTPIVEVARPLSGYIYEDAYSQCVPVGIAKASVPTRLVVSVFLEGWDHDMTSSLIDASFGLDLGFVAVFNPEAGDFFAS